MDNKNWLIFIEFIFILFFSLVEIILCIDQQFEACVPKTCGASILNISYPFWINGAQDSTCGFPGFELYCNNTEPILRISGEEYVVKNISYGNQSLLVVKLGAQQMEICSPATYRMKFYRSPFTFVPGSVNISIFFNCSLLTLDTYSRYSLGCSTDNSTQSSLALFSDNPLLNDLNQSVKCGRYESAPVGLIANGSLVTSRNRESIVDLSNLGFNLNWNASRCDECEGSGGRCGFNFAMYKFMCFCPDQPHHRRCGNQNKVRVGGRLGIELGAAIGCMLVMVILIICWKWPHLSSNSIMFWKRTEKTQRVVEDFLKNYGSLVPRRYNYYDIKMITNSFKDKIGQGGFGEVYKGKLVDGRVVAVKLLNKANNDGEEFINEVASISRTSHVNVVNLLGFCFDGSKRALMYEFMVNGSLEKFIYDQNPLEAESHLGWELLYQIAIGVARGLEYLHRGCNTRILHFDIKPHNILLDQDFIPKISDFGLAKLCPRNESIISMLGARGTAGYIAPEVFSRQFGGVSHKSDVYSYGMMVLEIVGKRKNIDVQVDRTSEIYFPKWIYRRLEQNEELGLRGITSKEEGEITRKMILVALWCIQANPMDRPAMTKVVEMLEGRHESVSIPPKPYLCSPPRSTVGSSNT